MFSMLLVCAKLYEMNTCTLFVCCSSVYRNSQTQNDNNTNTQRWSINCLFNQLWKSEIISQIFVIASHGWKVGIKEPEKYGSK